MREIQKNVSGLYAEILDRLDEARRKQNRLALVSGLLKAVLAVIAVPTVVILLEQIFSFGTTGRTALFALAALAVVGAIGWFVGRPLLVVLGLLSSENTAALAGRVGSYFPAIRDRLLDALQMYEQREKLEKNYSVELIDASFADLYTAIQPLRFVEAVDNPRLRILKQYALYTAAVCLLIFVVSPAGFLGSFYRVVHFGQSFAAPQPILFTILPGNAEVVRGQNVPVVIRTEGKPVQSIALHTRQQGQLDFEKLNLTRAPDGSFKSEMANMKLSTEYFASAEDIESNRYTIKVLDRPLIRSLQVGVTSPAYTRIPARQLEENAGDVAAYPGSHVTVRLTASKEISSATIVFNDSTQLPMKTDGRGAAAGFPVRKNRTYHVELRDRDGLPNMDPVEYSIKLLVDEYPTAEILSPAKNVDLAEDMKLSLLVRVKDDFGFSQARLAYRLAQSRYEKPADAFSYIDIPLAQKHQSPVDAWFHWELASLNLVPEDALAYYVEVFDNDNVSGPKSGRSETYIVRLPSLEEVFSDVNQSHQQSMESMQSVANETQQLKKDVEEMQREMKKNRDKMDWQQQKKAEEMLQRYESMKQKLQEASQKMDEMMKKMDENQLLSDQTMQKYQELQKLMEQLKSPELQEALKKLQESMKQLSPDQMKQAMEQLKMSEDQFRQNLERTIELLKRIHIEQKVDELIKRAEELKKQQESLRQQASKSQNADQQKRDDLAQQQQDLKKQAESLQKEASDLKKKMEEFPKEMPAEAMAKAEQNLQGKQTPQKMQQSSQQMQSGNMQGAQQNQEQSEQDLQEFMEQMQQIQKSMQDQMAKQIANELRKQMQNAVELSKRQESLKDDTKQLDPNSQSFRENAQEQNEMMSDLGNVADALSKLAKKTFAISPEMGKEVGNAMKQMGEAMKQMEQRDPSGASEQQGGAMSSLNRAAMMMQSALEGMMDGQGGMGMAGLMGRLKQMSGAQGGINSGTQQAMGMGPGLSPQQQAEYQRLAGQQGAVQKSLEQLAAEAKNAGEFSKLLGDLDRVAQEMQEVQTDLSQGDVNPETLQKQEKILSRLLDSQRSMRERDFEKRRKAEGGKEYTRTSPGEIDLSTQEGRNKLREEMLKIRAGKYSKDYEALIKKYFEQLEKESQPR